MSQPTAAPVGPVAPIGHPGPGPAGHLAAPSITIAPTRRPAPAPITANPVEEVLHRGS